MSFNYERAARLIKLKERIQEHLEDYRYGSPEYNYWDYHWRVLDRWVDQLLRAA